MRRVGALEVTLVVLLAQMALFSSFGYASAFGILVYWPTGASEPEMAWIPEPYELYGVARDEYGVVLDNGEPIRTFVDGVEYSNKSSVFSRPGYSDGFFQVETHGNLMTNRVIPDTPWIKEGADENESVMYVWGDMSDNTSKGIVFKETHNWTTGSIDAGDLNAAQTAFQPPLIKVYSITTHSAVTTLNDYVWLCNPTPNAVDGSQFYIQKDVLGDMNGPSVPVTGTIPANGGKLFVNLQSPDYFVETGDNVKLVWRNSPGAGAAYGGNDIIVDRVEFNATVNGTLLWEPGNTIQRDEIVPGPGQQLNRSLTCGDTNSVNQDFFINTEIIDNFRPLQPWPLTIDGLSSDSIDERMYHFTNLSGYVLRWRHLDPELDPQIKASVAISYGSNRAGLVWITEITGANQSVMYNGTSLVPCQDYWYSVKTQDYMGWGALADLRFHTNCIPSPVNLLSPPDGTIDLLPGSQVLFWTVSTDGDPADPVRYTWQVSTDSGFATIFTEGVAALNRSSPFTTNPSTLYYWRVNASDGWQSTPYTTPWSFGTSSVIPPTVSIQLPAGGEDWTGGSQHAISFTIGDDVDVQLHVVIDGSLDGGAGGYPIPLYGGDLDVGTHTFPWPLPSVDSTAVRIRIIVRDSDLLEGSATSGDFTIDSTPPGLAIVTPANGTLDVALTEQIQVEFTELVNHSSAEGAFSISPDPGGIIFSWSSISPGRELLVIGHQPFGSLSEYVVTFGVALRDVSDPGNAPSASLTFRFTTKTTTIPRVPPTAHAAAKSPVLTGEAVMLDGSGSTGNITLFTWTIADSGSRIIAVLTGEFANFTFERQGTYSVTLTALDEVTGSASQDKLEIVVNPRSGFDWLPLLLIGAAIVSGGLIAGTEVGRVALLMLFVAPIYKRKVKDEEDPEIRGLILGYIIGNPGDNYTDIKRNLKLNNGPLSWHLMKLLKANKIKSRVDGSKRRYYPYNMPLPVENGGELHEIQRRLIKAIEADSGKPVKFLAEELGISSQLALYHLRKLSQRNLLTLERQGLQLRVFQREKPKA